MRDIEKRINEMVRKRIIPSGCYLLEKATTGYETEPVEYKNKINKIKNAMKNYRKNPIHYQIFGGEEKTVKVYIVHSHNLGEGNIVYNIELNNGIKLPCLSNSEYKAIKNKLEYMHI